MKNKALKRLIYGLLIILGSLPFFLFASNSSLQTDTVTGTGYKIKTIIVDPGHGGRPSGTTGT